MKVLIVTTSFPGENESEIGGKFVYYEALGYSLNGADVTVLTPHFRGASKRKEINDNLRIIRFRYFWPATFQTLVNNQTPIYGKVNFLRLLNIPFFIISFFFNVLKYGRRADVIHCSWTPTVLFALPVRFFFKTPIVLTPRGSDIRMLPKWLNKWIFKKVDATIDCYGPQKWTADLKKNFPSNFITLPLLSEKVEDGGMPEDLLQLKGFSECDLKILFLGRIDPVKKDLFGLPLFEIIAAAKVLLDEGIDIQVCFIGGGDEDIIADLIKLIADLDIQDNIHLLGFRKKPIPYFEYFDAGLGGIAFNSVSQEFARNALLQILVNTLDNRDTPWVNEKNCYFVEQGSTESIVDVLRMIFRRKENDTVIRNAAYEMISKYVTTPEEGGAKYLSAFSKIMNDRNI